MKEYYIVENGEKKGAFSLKDLKYETVLPDTLIWKEGWAEWKKVKDAINDIPEIELIINDTPPVPQQEQKPKKKKRDMLTTLYKVSEGDLEEIGSLIEGDDKKKENEEKDKTSWTNRIYSFVGDHIDMLLAKNQDKIGSDFFYTKLSGVREFYKGLSPVRQISFSFLISCFVVFVIVFFAGFITEASFDLGTFILGGIGLTIIWAAFSALNQIKFIDSPINKVVDTIVLFTMGFLPKALKRGIAKFVKFLIFCVIIWFVGFPLGIGYIAYRVIIAFVNPDKLPSFEQFK